MRNTHSGGNPYSSPLILAIETATNCGSVAVVSGKNCLSEYTIQSKTTHSRRIAGQIADVVSEAGVDFQDIDAIAVSLGPGSFTGLRIGLSTAKGLAMACNSRIIGVSTLDALALQLNDQPGRTICSVLDARKKEVYAAIYQSTGNQLEQVSPPIAAKPSDLAKLISEPAIFIGNGNEVYGGLFQEFLGDFYRPADPEIYFPRAVFVASLAREKFSAEKFDDHATMVPVYIRKSEAEVNRAKKITR